MGIEIYENKLTVDSYIEIKKTAFKINNSKLQIEKSLKNDLYDNEKINIRACDFDEIDNIFDNQIKHLRDME